jgi:hypothetical protein
MAAVAGGYRGNSSNGGYNKGRSQGPRYSGDVRSYGNRDNRDGGGGGGFKGGGRKRSS